MSYERHTAMHKIAELKMGSEKRAERMRRALNERLSGQFESATLRGVQSALVGEQYGQTIPKAVRSALTGFELELPSGPQLMGTPFEYPVIVHAAHVVEEIVVKKVKLSDSPKPRYLAEKITIKDACDHVIIPATKIKV